MSKDKENKDENMDDQNIESSSENGSIEEQIEEQRVELAELKDKYLRIHAEFDNFRKRTMKEKMEFLKTASQDVIEDLLPVLDDFDRAKKIAEETDGIQYSEGMALIHNKLDHILKGKGLESMVSTGEPFDPDYHEAITKIPAPSPEMKGKVIDTIENGYILKDKIIRYAKVVVAE